MHCFLVKLICSFFLSKPSQIVLPVIRDKYFSVYIINFEKIKVHILDPNPWDAIGKGWLETHMG